MISPRKPESARPVVAAKPIPTAPRGHRHTIPTFSKPPSTSREFFAAYYCAEDDEQESNIRVPGSKGQALPPALQVSPNESLSSPGGRGQRPTPRKCRLLSDRPHDDASSSSPSKGGNIINNSTVNSNSQQGLLRSTVSGGESGTSTYRPNSAKWETDQGLVLKHELAQHVKYEREKEAYVRAHSLHRKPQRRLISKPAPKPPVMGTTAFGTCYSKDSGLSRNESSTMAGSPHEDTGESKHDMPDETVLGHVKFVTTSPRKAAKAPESRTVVMYGAASPINPNTMSATPRKPQMANNTSNTPKLPMLTMHTQSATLPLSARSVATASGTSSMPLTSRQLRLIEADNKRKILKPPVTPDLPDALWEGDLTQLDTFEQVHHQLKNVSVANDDNRPLSRTAGGTLRSPTNGGGGGGGQMRPRLEASLGETMVPYGPNDSFDDEYPPARKRDYQLIKAVFRAMMLQDTYPCRMMRALGGAEVLRRHEDIVQRYGYKRLNRDDFHYQIVEILKIQQHTIDRKDTNMMFDAFDTALSGYVSEREFEQGIHWVMQGPDERRRIVASYCKHFLSARNVMEAVVSLLEIDMMLTAIVDTCEGRFPGVREDAAGIQARLEPLTRHGTVPFPLFYEAVSKSRLVGRVVKLMQPNGTLPQTFLQSADPDPNREVGTLTVAIDNLQFAEGTMFQATTASSSGGVDPTGRSSKVGGASQQGRGSTTGAVAPSPGGEHGGGGAKPAGGGLVDLTHPRFKADLSARPQEYRPTPEHDEVKWCLRNGIVWRE